MNESVLPPMVSAVRAPLVLHTPRLRLRPFEAADLAPMHGWFCDPEVTRFTSRRVLSEAESWRVLCVAIGHWSVRGYGPYAVVGEDHGTVIGSVGFWYPYDWPAPEIKWTLARRYWGRGYAREAAAAVVGAARLHLPDEGFISLVDPDNRRSVGVANALGATRGDAIRLHGANCVVYHHGRSVAPR